MKVRNTRKINDRIAEYQSRQGLNQFISAVIGLPVAAEQIVFDCPNKLESFKNTFHDYMTENGINFTDDELLIASMVISVLDDELGSFMEFPFEIFHEIVTNSHVFHRGELEKNPYLQNIRIEPQSYGRFSLQKAYYAKYELFMYNTPKDAFSGVMIPAIGTADYCYRYPMITENGRPWMSITPNEMYTMQESIGEAHGNVLTLGCGMGYFAYMAALKDSVDHVTIVEKEPEVISLFRTCILPQFSCKDKISIIEADAFEYMSTLEDGKYDYCFADIWYGANDSVPYLKLKQICKKFSNMQMSYWIEDALVIMMMNIVYFIITAEYCKNLHMKVPEINIDAMPQNEKYKMGYFQNLLENKEINSKEDVDFYMDYRNIIKLMS